MIKKIKKLFFAISILTLTGSTSLNAHYFSVNAVDHYFGPQQETCISRFADESVNRIFDRMDKFRTDFERRPYTTTAFAVGKTALLSYKAVKLARVALPIFLAL